MKAAIYCRLSKEDENRGAESESIQNQKALLAEYAQKQGYDIYGVYIDEDYSGIDPDRPAFNRLLREAQEKRFQVILVKTQSRFTRDMELVEKYLHGRFVEWGIRFIAVVDQADTDDSANKKTRQINGLVNEWYLEDLSRNVRSVLSHKQREGKYIASFALYGYQKDPADKNHLVIDPVAAPVVERIFALFLSGMGAGSIAALLNREGVPNPTLYRRMKEERGADVPMPCAAQGLWGKATLYQMLHNRTYAGDLVQGRHHKLSYKSPKTVWLPPSQWVVVGGTHQPLICPEAFEEAQRLLAARARRGREGQIHPLAGKVFCDACKAAMERTSSGWEDKNGQRKQYLRCRTHARAKEQCPQTSIPLWELEEVVCQRLRAHLEEWFSIEKLDMSRPRAQALGRQRQKENELSRVRAHIQGRLTALEALYLDKSEGRIDPESFCQLSARCQAEKKALQSRAEQLEGELAPRPNEEAREKQWQRQAQTLCEIPALTRPLVLRMIESIWVGLPNPKTGIRQVEIHWNF